jgi:hypothetical protein
MVFNFNQMPEVVGAWMVAYRDNDWLAMVFKEVLIGPWVFRSRIRFYDPRDPDPWAGVDRRHWAEVHLPADTPREPLVALGLRLVARLRDEGPEPPVGTDEVLVEGDGQALIQALMTRPWMHAKHGDDARAWQRALEGDEAAAVLLLAGLLPGERRALPRACERIERWLAQLDDEEGRR